MQIDYGKSFTISLFGTIKFDPKVGIFSILYKINCANFSYSKALCLLYKDTHLF